MNSGMSNFNIKKSFVWKYGLSKLHKKKAGEESEPECEPSADDASSCYSLEPDLALQPHWEPLVWRPTDDPTTLPEKRRSLDPAPAGAGAGAAPEPPPAAAAAAAAEAAAEAALPGYAVAGCRRVSVDGELPIYESLSEYGGARSEDQQTLYENDDTDEELSPLYENGPLSPVPVNPPGDHRQPIYANDDVEEEPPIYENLFEEEIVVARRPAAAAATAATTAVAAAREVEESQYDDLRVEVRSDHGYDSYQSPSSGSSGGSSGSRRSSGTAEMMRASPKQEPGAETGSQRGDPEPPTPPASAPASVPETVPKPDSKSAPGTETKAAVESASMTASEAMPKQGMKTECDAGLKTVPPATPETVAKTASDSLSQKTEPVSVKSVAMSGKPEPASGKPAPISGKPASKAAEPTRGQPASLTDLLSAESLLSAKQALKQSRVVNMVRPVAVKPTKANTVLSGSASKKPDEVKKVNGVNKSFSNMSSGEEEKKTKDDLTGPKSLQLETKPMAIPANDAPLSLSIPPQETNKPRSDDPSLSRDPPKQNTSFLHNGRSVGKLGDNAGFQLARKAIAQALHRRTAPPERTEQLKPKVTSSAAPSAGQSPSRPDLTAPVERVTLTPGVIPPPPPMPGQSLTSPAKQAPAAAKPAYQSPVKPSCQTSAKQSCQSPAKPSGQTSTKPASTPALQSGLKKKLEAKKISMAAEKLPQKKKRMAPKPPDRSLSLPGYGNSKMDIAKAFEEYKRNEEEKEREARSKKQKSSFLDELDAKMSKKSASKSSKGKHTAINLNVETTKENELNTHASKKHCLGKHSFNKFECSEYDLMHSMALPKMSANNPAAQRISKREAREAKKKRQSPRIPSSLICASFPQQSTTTDASDRHPVDVPASETAKSYETVRDSTEITITDRIDPAIPTQKPNRAGGADHFRVASLVTPDVRTSGADRMLSGRQSPDDWLSTGECLLTARDCCVTVGGLQVIRIAPEEPDEPPAPTAAPTAAPTTAPISLTVTTDLTGQTHAAPTDRVALQVSHGGRYHSSVVEVNAAQTWDDPAAPSAGPRTGDPGWARAGSLGSAPPGSPAGSDADSPRCDADCVAPLVISVSEVERRFERLERDRSWREEEDDEEEEEDEEEEVQLRRSSGRNRQRTVSEHDATTLRTPKRVEVLSIIANKQKTKHFLEHRIQADLSAAESSPSPSGSDRGSSGGGSGVGGGAGSVDCSPAPSSRHSSRHSSVHSSPVCSSRAAGRSSRMSAPAPLCVPGGVGAADPGSGLGSAGRRRSSVDAGAPETRIAREIREQRCREEELRRLRAAAGPASPPGPPGPPGPPSPPSTAAAGHDEPLSGYGSEEKDSLAEEADSCGRGPASRPLSRSQESLSSGHSSGLGSELPAAELAGRRRVTVRPYEDQQDADQWSSAFRSTETPIEREIRLTREREEETRREQALRAPKPTSASRSRPQAGQTSVTTQLRRPAPAPAPAPVEDHRQAALRLATGRVQHEIQEATRRELELRDEGHTITTSEETVDEKVTRLGDMTAHSNQLRQKRSEPAPRPAPASSRPAPASSRPAPASSRPAPASSRPALRPASRPVPRPAPVAPPVTTTPPATPTFRPAAGTGTGRGLMAKFISSRGKLRPAGAFAAAAPPPPPLARGVSVPERAAAPGGRRAAPAPAPAAAAAVRRGRSSEPAPAQRRLQTSWSLDNPAVSSGPHSTERRVSGGAGNRRLLTAEEKIQLELKLMKEREDELRRERSWALARSQPDLLAALGEADFPEEDAAPAPGQLTRTMSNPNLLDDPDQMPSGLSSGRRRSGLIDQWESRIQGTKT